jgi:hypothetical protein
LLFGCLGSFGYGLSSSLSEFMLSWEWYCGALSALRCLLSNYYNIESFAVNLEKIQVKALF